MAQNIPGYGVYLDGFEPVEGEDCFQVDCLNGGWCIDGELGDGKFSCLCTSAYQQAGGSKLIYGEDPALCETNSTSREFIRYLNEPYTAAASTNDNEDSNLSGFETVLVAIICVLVRVVHCWRLPP